MCNEEKISQWKQKIETLELVDKHFKRAAMNMFNDLNENVSILRIEVEFS